jgi:3-methyl-2-oxobutanoate hydroxymethyltransferase
LIEDAKAIQAAGAYSLLVEAVPPEVCKIIRDQLTIPVYSIGAGIDADGQLMIVSDILGIFQAFTPKFVKKYANLGQETLKALSTYADDVRAGRFPETQHTYSMVDGEFPKLKKGLKKQGR